MGQQSGPEIGAALVEVMFSERSGLAASGDAKAAFQLAQPVEHL